MTTLDLEFDWGNVRGEYDPKNLPTILEALPGPRHCVGGGIARVIGNLAILVRDGKLENAAVILKLPAIKIEPVNASVLFGEAFYDVWVTSKETGTQIGIWSNKQLIQLEEQPDTAPPFIDLNTLDTHFVETLPLNRKGIRTLLSELQQCNGITLPTLREFVLTSTNVKNEMDMISHSSFFGIPRPAFVWDNND